MRQLITESVDPDAARRRRRPCSWPPPACRSSPASFRHRCRSPRSPVLDLRVVAFAALFTALTAFGFGLFPAIRAGRRTGFDALREGARAGGGAKQRLRAVLVTVEVTMSVILLITSGLLIRAVWRVQAIDPGFRPESVLTLQTALPRPKYDSPLRRGEFYDRVLARVRALPGVQSAAFTSGLPMVMTGSSPASRSPAGRRGATAPKASATAG